MMHFCFLKQAMTFSAHLVASQLWVSDKDIDKHILACYWYLINQIKGLNLALNYKEMCMLHFLLLFTVIVEGDERTKIV